MQLVSQLTSPERNHNLRAQINDNATLGEPDNYDAHFGGTDEVGTSHAVVVAPNGDVVSVTSSVND